MSRNGPPAPPAIEAAPLDVITAEAERLARAAVEGGLELRLMGGVAVYLTSPTVRRPPLARSYGDLDFVVSSRDKKAAGAFLEAAGYRPEKMFNALHGAQRLNYLHPDGRWPIDVVVDEVRMSHRLDLRGRLGSGGLALDLADLLLTKLQIWEINPKDLGDIAALLADHEVADDDAAEVIDRRRVLALVRDDWGWCHTVERNLRRAGDHAAATALDGTPYDVRAQVTALLAAIEAAPKSLGWRTRARVGERKRWYETPEEVRH